MRGDRSELGLLAAGGNHKLIEVKERRVSFAFDTTLLAVAQHLVNGLGMVSFTLGDLHSIRTTAGRSQTTHVRDDVVLGAQDADLEIDTPQ